LPVLIVVRNQKSILKLPLHVHFRLVIHITFDRVAKIRNRRMPMGAWRLFRSKNTSGIFAFGRNDYVVPCCQVLWWISAIIF